MSNNWRAYLIDRAVLIGTAIISIPVFGIIAMMVTGIVSCTADLADGPPVPVRWHANKSSGPFKQTTFTLKVWHQHPGELRNGTVRVTAQGSGWGPTTREWSFESWQPNRDAATDFRWQLTREQLLGEVSVHLEVDAKGMRKFVMNQRLPPEAFK